MARWFCRAQARSLVPEAQSPRPKAQSRKPKAVLMLYPVVRPIVWVVMRVFFRLRVRGARNIPEKGGVLIASNHQSFLDPMVIAAGAMRPVSFMARDTLFRRGGFGWLIGHLNAFPVRRGAADPDALHEAIRRLAAGGVLLVFAEGSRTRDGGIGRVRSGPALLAHRAGVPIVPAVIKGAFEAWPRSRKIFRLRRISVRFGEPIDPPADGERDSYEGVRAEIQRRLEGMMKEMMNDE